MAEQTMSVADARQCLPDLVERARRFDQSTVLTESGEPVARIAPVHMNQSTAHRLADWWRSRPRLAPEEAEAFEKDLIQSRKSLKRPA